MICVNLIWVLILLSGCQAVNQPKMTPTALPQQDSNRSTTMPTRVNETPLVTAPPRPSPTRPPRASATPAPTLAPGMVQYSPGPVTVPILLYHRVLNRGSTRYILPVSEFRAQMKALHAAGYTTITISRLAEVMHSGGALPEKPVVITFDDGYLDVYENAFPILEEYDFQAVAYIISGTVGTDLSYGYMQEEQLRELVEAGWEIGSHSVSHSNLETSRLGIRTELRDSKRDLEEKLSIEVLSFSYPYAVTNDWIQKRVEEYGYTSAVGVGLPIRHTPEHLYYLSRREVYRGTPVREFLAMLDEEADMILSPTAAWKKPCRSGEACVE